jgi:phosphate transport system substrate-binding protein
MRPPKGDLSMLTRRSFATALLVAVAISGCRPASPPAAAPAQPAEPAIRVSGSGAALPLVQKLAEAYSREHPSATFAIDAGTNSGGGIQGVIKGTLDLAVANRPLKESEAKETLEVHPFARDAVVFAAHPANPLEGLSTSDVREVYSGNVTDWGQIGGTPGALLVLDRDPDEPQRSLFLLKLLDGRPVQARTTVLTSARDMLQTLEATSDSLGYTTLALLRIRQPKGVRVLALDGVTPGRQSLVEGTYPWYLTYSLINRPDAPSSVNRFFDFVRGPGGQRVLDEYDAATPA